MPPLRPLAAALWLTFAATRAEAQDPAPEAPVAAPAAPATTPAAADSITWANNVLVDTILKLQARPRIAARIDQSVDMLNQKLELSGSYYKDTGNRVRLQLGLEGASGTGSKMLQVCDGKVLWDYQEVLGMKSYQKKDIVPILKKLEDPILDDQIRYTVRTQLGFGGPESLLIGFQTAIAFDQYAERDVDGVLTQVLGGKWKDRSAILGPNERALRPTDPLPPYVPSNIQLFIDKARGWPYRVEMIGRKDTDLLKQDARQIDPVTKRPIGPLRTQSEVEPTVITLRYILLPESEIKPDEQFVFSAPRDASNIVIVDATDGFLAQLDQIIKYKQQEKQAKEAAEGADDAAKPFPAIELAPAGPASPSAIPAPAPTPVPR